MVKRSIEAAGSGVASDVDNRERHYKMMVTRYVQNSDVDAISALLSSLDDAELKTRLIGPKD